MRALVTGATGFIGSRLLASLENPVVLTRSPVAHRASGAAVHAWDPAGEPPSPEVCAGVDAVVHLAGESVAQGRWTAARKDLIRESRVAGTRTLVRLLERCPTRPRVLVCASAVGYYGDRGDEFLDEGASPGGDFLAEVCRAWEGEARKAEALGVRVVLLRTGVALGRGGGALAKMLLPFRLGLGGRLGLGRQWMPWVHRDDVVGLILHAIHKEVVRGPVNAVAPNPVTNRGFTRTLASVLGRPAFLPVPPFALRLAVGEMAGVLLASQRAVPMVARKTGYEFRFPALPDALQEAAG